MQVKLSSQNREIISYGTVFLFDENSDLTLNINGDNYFELTLTISFVEDISQKQRIETNIFENHLNIICINFMAMGTGLTTPLEIAVIDGKKIYLMFWAYLEGSEDKKSKVRKVEYTLYRE